ncbi:hypothetical protein JNK13_09865 [bacterium]|nr:hypothetical protein [bacterium]
MFYRRAFGHILDLVLVLFPALFLFFYAKELHPGMVASFIGSIVRDDLVTNPREGLLIFSFLNIPLRVTAALLMLIILFGPWFIDHAYLRSMLSRHTLLNIFLAFSVSMVVLIVDWFFLSHAVFVHTIAILLSVAQLIYGENLTWLIGASVIYSLPLYLLAMTKALLEK